MRLRHGWIRWGVGLVLAITAVLALSASASAQTGTVSASAAALKCRATFGFAQVTLPGIGAVDVVDHLTTRGKGAEQFSATAFPPHEEPVTVVQLSTLEHAACAKTRNESKFSADGLAVFLGQERYSMSLTVRIFGGHTYLSLFLLKPGFKSLRVTEAELAPWCKEVIV